MNSTWMESVVSYDHGARLAYPLRGNISLLRPQLVPLRDFRLRKRAVEAFGRVSLRPNPPGDNAWMLVIAALYYE